MIKYYMAPLEGITTYIFRRTHRKYFPVMDKYFTPFLVSPNLNCKEINEIHPDNNKDINLVPQILTHQSGEFLEIAKSVSEYGYKTVNLNIGCPAGTVVSKGRGAGMLSDPDRLDKFLYEIYDKCPLDISVKTRIGIFDTCEWEDILQVFSKYKMQELIIHPRLQKELYKGTPHIEEFLLACDSLDIPLCYNGDINKPADTEKLFKLTEGENSFDAIMIGRGLIKNPALMCLINGTPVPDKKTFKNYIEDLLEEYRENMSSDKPALCKMIEIWTYLESSFTNPEKYMKQIKKSRSVAEYRVAVNALFREQDLIY